MASRRVPGVEQTAATIRGSQLARYRMERRQRSAVIEAEFAHCMAVLERGPTAQEVVDAAAMLAVPPSERQGALRLGVKPCR